MKKFFKTNEHCRKTTKVVRVTLFIIICVAIFCTIKLYYVNHHNVENPQFTDGNLKVIMIDVGNGDCFLALQNNKALLVDTGFLRTYGKLDKVLKENNVKKIDYAILTHPHPDHIGGNFGLFLNYRIDKLYLAENLGEVEMSVSETLFCIPAKAIIKYNNLFADNIVDVTEVEDGKYDFEFADSKVQFVSPINRNYKKINNYSLVFNLLYGKNKILFAADMEKINEKELLDSNINLSADVLKIAHHGSNTSSSEEFLDAVNPKYAIISSGNGKYNKYGHPVKRIVQYLEKNQIPLYRTDELGCVEFEADGKNIEFVQEPGDYRSGTQLLEDKEEESRM